MPVDYFFEAEVPLALSGSCVVAIMRLCDTNWYNSLLSDKKKTLDFQHPLLFFTLKKNIRFIWLPISSTMVLAPSSFLSFINPLLEKMQDTAPFLAMKDVLGLNIFFLTAVGAWGIFLGYLKSSYHGDMDEKWPVVLGMVLGCIAVAADFLWEVIQDYVYVCSEDLAEPEEGALPDTADDWGWRQFFNVNRKYVGIYWMVHAIFSSMKLTPTCVGSWAKIYFSTSKTGETFQILLLVPAGK